MAASDFDLAGSGWDGQDDWAGPTEEEMAEQEAILAAYLAAEGDTEPPDEAEAFPAEVSDHDGTGPGGTSSDEPSPGRHSPGGPGFASGSTLDLLEPGAVLTGALDDAWRKGLAALPDDELAGVALAWRRCESRAVAGMLAAVGELSRRREATRDWRVADQIDSEIAILMALTRCSAGRLLEFTGGLAQLPATSAALAAGRIDRVKASLITEETALLDPELAAAVEQLVIEDAPTLTTTMLRRRLRRAVLAADPAAARKRVEHAVRDARVELNDERSGGTAALAGRDLPVAGALAADQRIDAAARAMKADGAAASLPQLRAAVFLGLLTGTDPVSFLSAAIVGQNVDEASSTDAAGSEPNGEAATATAEPASDTRPPAEGNATTETTGADSGDRHEPDPPTDASGPSAPSSTTAPTGSTGPTNRPGEPWSGPAAPWPGPNGVPPDPNGAWPGPGGLTLRGSVNLTLPLATWLGASRSPGDIMGFGPGTAETCQDLADWIAQNPGSRWCVTLTDKKGHAVGHGCARRPPPPASDTQGLAAWLARLKIGPIEAGTCTHAREVPGYRIPASLHHVVKVRQQSCASPICSRPAIKCDDDHTVPHDQGGRTCECDLAPLCRTDHRCKQTPGWRLEQPSPGTLIWHLPSGRRYTVTPGVYPT